MSVHEFVTAGAKFHFYEIFLGAIRYVRIIGQKKILNNKNFLKSKSFYFCKRDKISKSRKIVYVVCVCLCGQYRL